jgi:hypothetical protein
MNSVKLHIDRIVVHGLPRASGPRFAIALEEKLREWAERGLPGALPDGGPQAIPSIDAGRLRRGATPAQAAGQVVQAIHQHLEAAAAPPVNRSAGRGDV